MRKVTTFLNSINMAGKKERTSFSLNPRTIAKLRGCADKDKRSMASELEWLVDRRSEELQFELPANWVPPVKTPKEDKPPKGKQ